jgi:hypothetical protein
MTEPWRRIFQQRVNSSGSISRIPPADPSTTVVNLGIRLLAERNAPKGRRWRGRPGT